MAEAKGVVGALPQPQNTQPLPEPVAPLKKASIERTVDIVASGAVSSVEEFIPDGAVLDNSFLEDVDSNSNSTKPTAAADDSDRWLNYFIFID
jgi:hypothetical protein